MDDVRRRKTRERRVGRKMREGTLTMSGGGRLEKVG